MSGYGNGTSPKEPVDLRRLVAILSATIVVAAIAIEFIGRLNGLPESVPLHALAGVALGVLASSLAPRGKGNGH